MLFILLCRVTEAGQQAMLRDPETFAHVAEEINVDGAQILARYAVLGRYDYVAMVEAGTHEDVARLSLELGARARVHVETLSTISVRQLVDPGDEELRTLAGVELRIPGAPNDNPPPDYPGPVTRT